MAERRYTEVEAAEIFRRAAEAEPGAARGVAPAQGLTLAQLQEIGREAGLDPALVARAAIAVSAPGGVTTRVLGLPLGVGRTIELDRPFTDEAWERLVADLRVTFAARGRLRYDGPFRQWSNGNLQVLVEPTPTGHRIRFGTLNGASRSMLAGGAAMLGLAAVVGVVSALGGTAVLADNIGAIGVLATMGAAFAGLGAVRLPLWARTRLRQMDGLLERLSEPAEASPLLLSEMDESQP
jgi:hypothetical protein